VIFCQVPLRPAHALARKDETHVAINSQAPGADNAQQAEIGLSGGDDTTPETAAPTILDWPAELPAQVAALRKLLPAVGQDPEALNACFGRKNKKRVDQINGILATLKALGHIA
jgi:hypothetical protein